MKALVFDGKDDLEVRNVDDPTIEEPTDAIIEVECALSSGSDLGLFEDPTIEEGHIFGADFAGVVREVGCDVTGFTPGDRVVPGVNTHCGDCSYCERGIWSHCEDGGWLLGYSIDGGRAEFARVPKADGNLDPVPASLEFEQVVAAMAALPTGFEAAERGKIEPGDTVAIIGAGAIGLCALECVQLWGPAETVVVGRHQPRLHVAEEMGADRVIDGDAQDAVETLQEVNNGEGVDVVVETAGSEGAYHAALQYARVGGTVVLLGVHDSTYDLPFDRLWGNTLTIRFGYLSANRIPLLIDLIDHGKIDVTPIINNEIRLEEVGGIDDIVGPEILKTAIYP